ncbi:hypothetical protein M0813_18537 [Anaeramoeba flamelloides]|uniref:Uncharacterized protein n=1 Tax=Anaeramoeba flamelloides TaxID=1746091 RepID=A0ABQ8YSJ1_9EUKA|nr:hypothetical protein M0813_18537 [Anaeramoeba flamelloides]
MSKKQKSKKKKEEIEAIREYLTDKSKKELISIFQKHPRYQKLQKPHQYLDKIVSLVQLNKSYKEDVEALIKGSIDEDSESDGNQNDSKDEDVKNKYTDSHTKDEDNEKSRKSRKQ